MAHASAICPECREESISMSSSVLARKRRLRHIAREHPEMDFEDPFLEQKGETFRASALRTAQ